MDQLNGRQNSSDQLLADDHQIPTRIAEGRDFTSHESSQGLQDRWPRGVSQSSSESAESFRDNSDSDEFVIFSLIEEPQIFGLPPARTHARSHQNRSIHEPEISNSERSNTVPPYIGSGDGRSIPSRHRRNIIRLREGREHRQRRVPLLIRTVLIFLGGAIPLLFEMCQLRDTLNQFFDHHVWILLRVANNPGLLKSDVVVRVPREFISIAALLAKEGLCPSTLGNHENLVFGSSPVRSEQRDRSSRNFDKSRSHRRPHENSHAGPSALERSKNDRTVLNSLLQRSIENLLRASPAFDILETQFNHRELILILLGERTSWKNTEGCDSSGRLDSHVCGDGSSMSARHHEKTRLVRSGVTLDGQIGDRKIEPGQCAEDDAEMFQDEEESFEIDKKKSWGAIWRLIADHKINIKPGVEPIACPIQLTSTLCESLTFRSALKNPYEICGSSVHFITQRRWRDLMGISPNLLSQFGWSNQMNTSNHLTSRSEELYHRVEVREVEGLKSELLNGETRLRGKILANGSQQRIGVLETQPPVLAFPDLISRQTCPKRVGSLAFVNLERIQASKASNGKKMASQKPSKTSPQVDNVDHEIENTIHNKSEVDEGRQQFEGSRSIAVFTALEIDDDITPTFIFRFIAVVFVFARWVCVEVKSIIEMFSPPAIWREVLGWCSLFSFRRFRKTLLFCSKIIQLWGFTIYKGFRIVFVLFDLLENRLIELFLLPSWRLLGLASREIPIQEETQQDDNETDNTDNETQQDRTPAPMNNNRMDGQTLALHAIWRTLNFCLHYLWWVVFLHL